MSTFVNTYSLRKMSTFFNTYSLMSPSFNTYSLCSLFYNSLVIELYITKMFKVNTAGWNTELRLESRPFDNGFYAVSLNSCHHSTLVLQTLRTKVKSTWSPSNPHEAMAPNGPIPRVHSPGPLSNNIWWDEPSLCIYVLGRLNINLPPGAIKKKKKS